MVELDFVHGSSPRTEEFLPVLQSQRRDCQIVETEQTTSISCKELDDLAQFAIVLFNKRAEIGRYICRRGMTQRGRRLLTCRSRTQDKCRRQNEKNVAHRSLDL